ncbi:hypothetical protein HELRODRAFT_193474 [Helobdella robusta]|uniref:DNA-directed RNA polymerase RBP11-like dimerisation domain-containing protein n=1 Tax=Helobdella robusta TaxID=6412 RepID=T1FV14_HELRO|nr:hypothetical protein HELRODRAFT_193474 [Helobdella robusta]ESN95790.1 hypothetical protein HELRODRAFT_193474 [Helobdella robusta]
MTDVNPKRLQKVHSSKDDDDDEKCQTYVITGEDHTLAGALNLMLHKNPDVRSAGYSIPHPLENKLMLQIAVRQKAKTTSDEVFKKALNDLNNQCQHILKTFEVACEMYKEKAGVNYSEDERMDVS